MPKIDRHIAVTEDSTELTVLPGDAANKAIRTVVVGGAAAGVQYTEGDTDSTITGTAVMWEDSGDTLRSVNTSKPLPVQAVVVNEKIVVNGVLYPVLWAEINASSSGDNTLLAAQGAGNKIRVLAVTFSCAAATTVAWKSAATTKIHAMSFATNGGMDVNRMPAGYFLETAANEALILTLGGAVSVCGSFSYAVVV